MEVFGNSFCFTTCYLIGWPKSRDLLYDSDARLYFFTLCVKCVFICVRIFLCVCFVGFLCDTIGRIFYIYLILMVSLRVFLMFIFIFNAETIVFEAKV